MIFGKQKSEMSFRIPDVPAAPDAPGREQNQLKAPLLIMGSEENGIYFLKMNVAIVQLTIKWYNDVRE